MRRIHTLVLGFLVLLQYVSAASWPNLPFRLETDFAQFRFESDTNYLEIYYSCEESRLSYVKKDEQYEGAILMHLSIHSSLTDSIEMVRIFRIPHGVPDTACLEGGKSFVGVIGLAIPDGEHRLAIESFDDHDRSRRDRVVYELPAKMLVRKTVALSDVELCTSIRKKPMDPTNVFFKNTFEIIPNPTKTYGPRTPILYYYLEAYNLLKARNKGTYYTKVGVYDSDNREIRAYDRWKQRTNESSVEVGSVNLSSLPTGTYRLQFSLTDSATNVTVSSSKKFLIYDRDRGPDRTTEAGGYDPLATEYILMAEDELNQEFGAVHYLMNLSEKSLVKELSSLDAKKKFLLNFWKERDADLRTPENEFRQVYMGRVQHANDTFQSGFKEGWKSDRGRVYIMYGPPDEYERYPMAPKPFEVWHYHNIDGGVQFVFADLLGLRDHELVHSTHRNEMHDDRWGARFHP